MLLIFQSATPVKSHYSKILLPFFAKHPFSSYSLGNPFSRAEAGLVLNLHKLYFHECSLNLDLRDLSPWTLLVDFPVNEETNKTYKGHLSQWNWRVEGKMRNKASKAR
jgi:hypothetical protein